MSGPLEQAPLRIELRALLEISSQPLALYAALVRQLDVIGCPGLLMALMRPEADGLRQTLTAIVPTIDRPYLSLSARVALMQLLSQTPLEEEAPLFMVLLEHLALGLEPYLSAALADPSQARYLAPLLGEYALTSRPTALLRAAREEASLQAHARQASRGRLSVQDPASLLDS